MKSAEELLREYYGIPSDEVIEDSLMGLDVVIYPCDVLILMKEFASQLIDHAADVMYPPTVPTSFTEGLHKTIKKKKFLNIKKDIK
ncbi:MAG: hypothetical protein ACTSO5_15300 [Candidatus Heimdallarchaeaceae archaeon]